MMCRMMRCRASDDAMSYTSTDCRRLQAQDHDKDQDQDQARLGEK